MFKIKVLIIFLGTVGFSLHREGCYEHNLDSVRLCQYLDWQPPQLCCPWCTQTYYFPWAYFRLSSRNAHCNGSRNNMGTCRLRCWRSLPSPEAPCECIWFLCSRKWRVIAGHILATTIWSVMGSREGAGDSWKQRMNFQLIVHNIAIIIHATSRSPLCFNLPCLQILLAERVNIDVRTTVERCPLRLLLEQPHSHNVLHLVRHSPYTKRISTYILIIRRKSMVNASG